MLREEFFFQITVYFKISHNIQINIFVIIIKHTFVSDSCVFHNRLISYLYLFKLFSFDFVRTRVHACKIYHFLPYYIQKIQMLHLYYKTIFNTRLIQLI